jgi:hypothetical protein
MTMSNIKSVSTYTNEPNRGDDSRDELHGRIGDPERSGKGLRALRKRR